MTRSILILLVVSLIAPAAFACGCTSPIAISLNGEPYEFTSAVDGVFFDLACHDVASMYAWTAPGSSIGWLAWDRDGNGNIDSGRELFGTCTKQPPCPADNPRCRNGFRALRVLDTNRDGKLDRRDKDFDKLVLWRDLNHDGLSTHELLTMKQLGIVSISLKFKILKRRWDKNGNQLGIAGTLRLRKSDGTIVPITIYDVWLQQFWNGEGAPPPHCCSNPPCE